jgi:hypothetical protein
MSTNSTAFTHFEQIGTLQGILWGVALDISLGLRDHAGLTHEELAQLAGRIAQAQAIAEQLGDAQEFAKHWQSK